MAEYIDREDALDAVLFALVGTGLQSAAIYAIREVPTADVVPKSEAERLHEALSKAEADVKNYMKVAEYQQSLSVKRYHEIKRLKEDIERLEEINERDVENLRLAKAEVAREIFEEIDIILSEHYGKASEKTDSKLLEPLRQAQRFVINEIYDDLAELKKKYTEEKT